MLRSFTIATLIAALAGQAAAQSIDDAGMDFVLRPTQDPYADALGEAAGSDSEFVPGDEPEVTGAIDLPVDDPADEPLVEPPPPRPDTPQPLPAAPEEPPAAVEEEQASPGPVAPTAAPEPPAQPQAPPRAVQSADSFDATGVRLGTFVLRPAIEVGVELTDNAAGGEEEESAAGLVLAPDIIIRQEGSKHELEAIARGEAITYGDREFDERFAEARLSGRYELTSRTDIEGEVAYTYELDRYTDPNTPDAAAERPAVHDLYASLGATHQLGVLAVGLSGSVDRSVHEEVPLADGGVASREELDNTAYGVTIRATYEARAATKPYVEASLGRRDYDVEPDSNGFERSSVWGDLRGGLLLDFGSKLSGDVSVGYRHEDVEDQELDDIDGLIAAASILWSPRRLTEVRVDLSTEVEPTSIPGSPGSLLYAGAVTVSRQLSPRLELEAGAGFSHERFTGIDRRDDIVSGFAGLSYAFNRTASLEARYVYERTDSTDFETATDENRVGVRVRVQR